MSYTGVYVGANPSELAAFEQLIGRQVDSVSVHTGWASWTDYTGSVGSAINTWAGTNRTFTYTIPLFASGGSLAGAATGAYDGYYKNVAQQLLNAQQDQSVIYIRTGVEFNASWFSWSAIGHQAEFIGAFQHFVDAFRSVAGGSKFKFEWNVANGDYGMDPASAYPGDAYVDVIGMDFYYDSGWDNPDPLQAWNAEVTRKYGLQWLENFATQHGKPTAYSEWGVSSDYAGAFIEQAQQWFTSHNSLYNNYWNINSTFMGSLTNGQYPQTAQAFSGIFGNKAPPASAMADNTYTATSSNQLIFEVAGGGTDTVLSAYDFRLGHEIENLTLTGSAALKGTGNDQDNVITGNSGANSLNGMSGADTLVGGAGNDSLSGGPDVDRLVGGLGDDAYYPDATTDVIVEAAGEGTDIIYTALGGNMPANVENMTLTSATNAYSFGNTLANLIVGNSGANQLKGMAGADTLNGGAGNDLLEGGSEADVLTGGAGADTFMYYKTSDSVGASTDRITDLATGDKIDLHVIDANTLVTGDQAFVLVGALTKVAGQAAVAYNATANLTTVNFDQNGDGVADMTLQLVGNQTAFTGWVL